MNQKTKGTQNKSNKTLWIIIGLVAIVMAVVLVLLRGDEDTWIKDDSGNWIKHGNPSSDMPK